MLKWIRSLCSLLNSKVAVVPPGFVLVPEKPSEAHIESMLSAAPTPEMVRITNEDEDK